MNNFYKFGIIPSSQPSSGDEGGIRGEAIYTTPGTYSWTCPEGVTSISVVAIGGGGVAHHLDIPKQILLFLHLVKQVEQDIKTIFQSYLANHIQWS